MNHFLLTTTALIASQFLSHLEQSEYHLWNDAHILNFDLAMYGSAPNGPELAFSTSAIAIVCSNPSSDESKFILKDYYFQNVKSKNDNLLEWTINKPNISCALLDQTNKFLWLIGDHAGSSPLWFSFHPNHHLLVTSDLFAAIALGFSDHTAVSSGFTLGIDLQSFEISAMNHWSQFYRGKEFQEPQLEHSSEWSGAILTAAQQVLSDTALSSLPLLVTELDLLDPSSILLECAIASQSNFTRARYHTPPLVIDLEPLPFVDSYTLRESFTSLPPSHTHAYFQILFNSMINPLDRHSLTQPGHPFLFSHHLLLTPPQPNEDRSGQSKNLPLCQRDGILFPCCSFTNKIPLI
jgi:hypothetical protein